MYLLSLKIRFFFETEQNESSNLVESITMTIDRVDYLLWRKQANRESRHSCRKIEYTLYFSNRKPFESPPSTSGPENKHPLLVEIIRKVYVA